MLGVILAAAIAIGCDLERPKAEKLAAEFDIPNVYTDFHEVLKRDGTMADEFGNARAYTFDVEEVHKGEVQGPTVRIGSRADTCDGGDGYLSGDLLATDKRILVYLFEVTGGLMTLTPGQGVVPLEEGAVLPFRHGKAVIGLQPTDGWPPIT